MPESALAITEMTPAPPPAGWITAGEAAEMLGVTTQTVVNRIKAGSIAGQLCRTPRGERWHVDPMSDPELSRVFSPVKLRPGEGRRALELDEKRRRTAELRLAAVRSWQAYRDTLAPSANLATAFSLWSASFSADRHLSRPVCSYTTMWRWEQRAAGGLAELAPNHRGRSAGQPSRAAWAFFQSLWLTQQRRTISDCYRQTAAESHKRGWQWVSEPACRRLVAAIPRAVVIERREGRKAFEDRCVPYVERDYDIPANGWWVVDHHQLDVFCIGKDGLTKCPWITYWQDVRSRKCMGVMLNEGPNTDVVLASLHRAILDYGVPEHLLFDNGKDFRAREVTGGYRLIRYEPDQPHILGSVAHLPTAVHFAQPYNAKAKTNERTFRTARMQFSQQWHSYRGRSVAERPEQLAKILAAHDRDKILPHWDELDAAVAQWFNDVYGEQPHAGRGLDGQTPNACYAANLGTVTRVDPDELAILMMRTSEPRVVGQNGIRVFGQLYGFPNMLQMLGRKVYARYDSRDVGKLYIFTLADELVGIATANDRGQWGATREDLGKHMRLKAQTRKIVAAYAENLQQVAGGVAAVKRQREAAELAASRRAAARANGRPDDPDGGGPAAAGHGRDLHLRIHRTRFIQAAEDLRTGKVAVGLGRPAVIRLAGGELVPGTAETVSLPTGETIDPASGEVLQEATGIEHQASGQEGRPSMDDLSEALHRSLSRTD